MKKLTIALTMIATQATAGSVTCMDLGYGMVSCSNGASAMEIAPGLTTYNYPTPAPRLGDMSYPVAPPMPIMPVVPIAPISPMQELRMQELQQSNSIRLPY